ncbi:hypothetical protein L798_14301 [Zootermopsis nevadensis]|uniref:Uncharacterized protein n=1 Tax=Zootermopsis nevadensis TaxID=136037 RepID=A0A067R1K3_ZOONE|nr:hypothetical protein L798_14301 [Zootermopsis nevadensis]
MATYKFRSGRWISNVSRNVLEVARELVEHAQRTDFGRMRWSRPKHALEGCQLQLVGSITSHSDCKTFKNWQNKNSPSLKKSGCPYVNLYKKLRMKTSVCREYCLFRQIQREAGVRTRDRKNQTQYF